MEPINDFLFADEIIFAVQMYSFFYPATIKFAFVFRAEPYVFSVNINEIEFVLRMDPENVILIHGI